MFALAAALGSGAPSFAVLEGGGAVAEREAPGHALGERQIVVLSGSGRLADRLAHTSSGADPVAAEVANRGRLVRVPTGFGAEAKVEIV